MIYQLRQQEQINKHSLLDVNGFSEGFLLTETGGSEKSKHVSEIFMKDIEVPQKTDNLSFNSY